MKFFKKALISISIVVLLFGFAFPKRVQADTDEIFGVLMNPIMSFFVGIGDGIMSIMQKAVLGMDESIIEVDDSADGWAKFFVILGAIALCVGVVIGTILTAGSGLVLALEIVGAVLKCTMIIGAVTIGFSTITTIVKGMLPSDLSLPIFELSPENIFSNKIPMLDVDFFSLNKYTDSEGNEVESIAYELRPIISNWYVILRNIAIVASLSILVYIGIRILISSSSEDKSKYKEMLVDWLVSLCLIFVMHYIMAFSNIVVNQITQAIDVDAVVSDKQTEINGVSVYYIADDENRIKNAYKILVETPVNNGKYSSAEETPYYHYFINYNVDGNGNVTSYEQDAGKNANCLVWPAKNFLQQARMECQIGGKDANESSTYSPTWITIGWKLIYCVLVVYTVIFLWTYVKRVVYMAFLTLIAPLVAMTYPLDKINDGKAQAFDMWFKEYIFNLLIQPMHLLLYTILVSSAFEFASKNVIYVAVCLGFIFPAEKMLRKFFGFEKAQTPGVLGGPAGAALMMNGMNKMFHRPPPPPLQGKDGGKIGGVSSSNDNDGNVRTVGSIDLGDASSASTSGDSETGGNIESLSGMNEPGADDHNEATLDEGEYGANVLDKDGNVIGQTTARDVTDNGSSQSTGNADFYPPAIIDNDDIVDQVGDNADFHPPAVIDDNNGGSHTLANMDNGGNDSQSTSSSNAKAKKGKIRGFFAGRAAAAGTAMRYAGRKIKQPKASDYLKAVGLVGGRMLFNATSTAIGVEGGAIAGIASGDPAKAAQYMALGGTAAFEQANRTHLPNWKPEPELQEAMDRAKYSAQGKDYDEVTTEKKKKEFKKDPNNWLKLEQNYGRKRAEEIMKHADEYYDNGIKDVDLMVATYDFQQQYKEDHNGREIGVQEASQYAKAAQYLGDTTKMSDKTSTDWKNTLVSRKKESEEYKKAVRENNTKKVKELDKKYESDTQVQWGYINNINKHRNEFNGKK